MIERLDRISLLARGDERTVSELYDETSQRLYSLALAVTGDAKTAEEVILDVFSALIPDAREERIVGTLDAYLVRNVRARSLAVRDRAAASRRATAPAPRATRASSAEIAREAVLQALASLAPAAREAVERVFFEGASESEIASGLGCGRDEARSELVRGMERLGEMLFPVPANRGR
ncbi:MAG TPA: RNA polymerase sigma factor, partial [Thermoanaerobaculia bacterium]|nr:RNA polymerase sigma factor [Thermoanaerobaculia bacterium]